jgi:hypothetical protein
MRIRRWELLHGGQQVTRVCPRIVGQLRAVVLQSGQARQNWDTPVTRVSRSSAVAWIQRALDSRTASGWSRSGRMRRSTISYSRAPPTASIRMRAPRGRSTRWRKTASSRASGILPGGRMKRLSPGPRARAQPKDQEAAGDPQDDGRRNRAGRLPGSPGGSQQLPIQRLRGARGGGKRHGQGRDGRGGSRGGGRRGSDGGHRRRRCGRGGCRCERSGGRRHGRCGGRGRGGGSGSRDCRHGPPGPARLLRPGRETQARARGSRAPALGSPGAPEPIGVDDPLFGWIIGATPMRLGLADLSRSATSGGRTGHSVDMEGFLRLLQEWTAFAARIRMSLAIRNPGIP